MFSSLHTWTLHTHTHTTHTRQTKQRYKCCLPLPLSSPIQPLQVAHMPARRTHRSPHSDSYPSVVWLDRTVRPNTCTCMSQRQLTTAIIITSKINNSNPTLYFPLLYTFLRAKKGEKKKKKKKKEQRCTLYCLTL